MAIEREPGSASLIDVLDRVLDKGIVIDAWVRVSLIGLDLLSVEARVVVASIETYLKYAKFVGPTRPTPIASMFNLGDDDDDDDDSGPGPGPGSGGAPSFAGTAATLPRNPPSRYRRPID